MENTEFTTLLKAPQNITKTQTNALKNLLLEYPYFQSAHAIHLKGIKEFYNDDYKKLLKKTAAYTTNRSILFNFITSEVFLQNNVSEYINSLETPDDAKNIRVNTEEIKNITEVASNKSTEASSSSSKKIAITKIAQLESPENSSTIDKTERHSFNEWLSLSQLNPIYRTETETEKQPVKEKSQSEQKREEKFKLIDAFLKKNPKLKPPKKDTPNVVNIANERTIKPEALMTETLAKIYVNQENYKKAIQSYKILSLKYPEKSTFFADRIKAIKKLQKNQERNTQ